MPDLYETLAGMREAADDLLGFTLEEERALLSAVQNVLALCDEADARQPEYFGFLVSPDVRKALTDALGSEPSNTGSEQ